MVLIAVFRKKAGVQWKECLKLETKNDKLDIPPAAAIQAVALSRDLKNIREIKIFIEGG